MNEKLTNALIELAHKLGTTVEHLWGVLVRQAPVEGMVSIFQYGLIIVGWVLWTNLTKRCTNDDWEDVSGRSVTVVVGAVILIVITVIAFFTIGTTATCFLNPEYWALQKVMGYAGR